MPSASPTPWYSDGLRFECTQCGNCCTGAPGYVNFTDDEAHAMAAALGITEPDLRARYTRQTPLGQSLTETETSFGHDCVFLSRDPATGKALCAVYKARPSQCRTWPFWPSNLGSKADWEDAAEHCAGMMNGLGEEGKFFPIDQIRILAGKSTGL